MTQQSRHYERALVNPLAVYSRPAQVLGDEALSDEQKLKILRRWETDSREMQVAEDEGMIGGEDDLFAEVIQAIHALDSKPAKKKSIEAPTKHGGSH